jgi:deoxyuridine 5'-triphosphate nucleotidohydrolase
MQTPTNMFRIQRLSPTAVIPVRATPGSAGLDLSASEACVVPAGGRALVSTGLAMQIPDDCYARIAPRSGLAVKHGINTGAGVVDSDYTGEVKVLLFNHGAADFEIRAGDRIAQVIFEKIYPKVVLEGVAGIEETARGGGGFGSTGVGAQL